MSNNNNKVSLDGKTLLVLMGMALTMLSMLAVFSVFVFKTNTEASIEHNLFSQADAVQLQVNKHMHETNKSQQKKIDAMYDNVLRIGVKVRAKDLQRVEE